MNKKIRLKRIVTLLVIMMSILPSAKAQDFVDDVKNKVKSHTQADPFTVSGTLGAAMDVSWNNQDVYSNHVPFSSTAYANLNFNIYGFSIPLSIDLLNVSMDQFSFPRPQIHFNTTPTWKNFRFHLGTSSMHFSNYTYSGLSFTGAGAEYQGSKFRAAGFYGRLNAPTRFTERDKRTAIQYLADSLLGLNVYNSDQPQFLRKAWGGKIGVGNAQNYLDLNVFRAIDDSTSLPMMWAPNGLDTTWRDSVVKAKENFTVGLSGRFSIKRWFSLSANLGASCYSNDLSVGAINAESLENYGYNDSTADPTLKKIVDLLGNTGGVYTIRNNSQFRLAGDAAMSFVFSKFNATFNYRMVQADYTSLGTTQTNQNAQGVGTNINMNLIKNRVFLGFVGYAQQDNLNQKQMFTNQLATYMVNLTANITQDLTLVASYNGVRQLQNDGLMVVNDSTRVNNLTSTIMVSPSYTIHGENDHTISLNFNKVNNVSLNTLLDGKNDVNTLSAGGGYDVFLENYKLGVGADYDYSMSRSLTNSYNSHTLSVNANYSLKKTKDLDLKANGVLSFGFNHVLESSELPDGYVNDILPESQPQNDINYGIRLGSSLSYKRAHNASMYLSVSNYSDHIIIGQRVSTKVDVRFNISYSYSFASRIIKNKKNDEKETKAKVTPLG